MKSYFISFACGALVGIFYALLKVRSPAPPLVALAGLLGMVLAEGAWPKLPAFAASLTNGASAAVAALKKW